MKSEQTEILLQKKQKKTQLRSKIIPQEQRWLNLEREKRIQSNPILVKLQQQTLASLKKTQQQYRLALQRNGIKEELIQKLLIHHRIKNNMLVGMFNHAYDRSKNPYETGRVFLQNASKVQEAQTDETSNQNNIAQLQLAQNEQDSLLNYISFNGANIQSNISSQMIIINNQTSSEIERQCRINQHYPKYFKFHQYKKIFSQNQRQLFQALMEHYKLLTNWLRLHRNQFKHIIRHQEQVREIPYKLKTPMECGQEWLGRYDKMYATIRQNHQLKVKDRHFRQKNTYCSKDQSNTLDYLIEVAEGLQQLIDHQIYHIDVKPDNYIPVHTQERAIFKFIDFEYALYLGKDLKLRQNVRLIWTYIKQYFQQGKIRFLKDMFDEILCPCLKQVKAKQVSQKNGQNLYRRFSKRQNQDDFVEYLRNYSVDYYRDRLMSIWKEISSDFMPASSKKIEQIIYYTPFETLASELRKIKFQTENQ